MIHVVIIFLCSCEEGSSFRRSFQARIIGVFGGTGREALDAMQRLVVACGSAEEY